VATIDVFVQGSSRSWQGGQDLCMNPVAGEPAIRATARKFLDASDDVRVTILAPAFDEGGPFDAMFEGLAPGRVRLVYAADESPLQRAVIAAEGMADSRHIIRVDGLHFPVLVDTVLEMYSAAVEGNFDCLKFPDDFPPQLGADVLRVGALCSLLASSPDGIWHVHPKYALYRDTEQYRTGFFEPPVVSDAYLKAARDAAETVYFIPRMDVNDKASEAGNQLTLHYQLALNYLSPGSEVLDIACGDGYGSRLMQGAGHKVTGGDIDADVIEVAKGRAKGLDNISFRQLDATSLDLPDACVDAILSMETIEHVDEAAYLSELNRVLRPGGLLILSTPQNSLGHIPVNAEHLREYSLAGIQAAVSRLFNIEHVIGLKQGRIIIKDSPLGTNMMVIARKPL